MPSFDPGFNEWLWWFTAGAFAGWLLFVLIDKLMWRDGYAAGERERTSLAELEAELEARRTEEAELRHEIDTRHHENRRLAELTEELRDRAAVQSQKVVNLENALAAARQGALGAGGVSAVLMSSIVDAPEAAASGLRESTPNSGDTGAPPLSAPASTTEATTPARPAAPSSATPAATSELAAATRRDDTSDEAADVRAPEQEAMFDPVTTIMRSNDGQIDEQTDDALRDAPRADLSNDRPATRPLPAQAPTSSEEEDPVQALRDILNDADDSLDSPTELRYDDDEELFGAPTEILTAFHLHEGDDVDNDDFGPDSDGLLDADTQTLFEETSGSGSTGGRRTGGTPAATGTSSRNPASLSSVRTRTMIDRLQGQPDATSAGSDDDGDRVEDTSLVSRLRGAFGRRKPTL